MEKFTKKYKLNKKRHVLVFVFLLIMMVGLSLSWFIISTTDQTKKIVNRQSSIVNLTTKSSPSPTLPPIPSSKILSNGGYHIFQSFNNCGPASLSMALRFYGENIDQTTLGNSLRPYQVAGGDNDDKSVTLEELAEKSKEFGFVPFHRPMGNPETVKQFIANDMPVIARTWTKPNEDIGHYRIIKGYDENLGIFIQDDSLQNKNLSYSYSDFNQLWKKFNYEYLVLVPVEKQKLAERILDENSDAQVAWQNAVENSKSELEVNPYDIDARFNLSVALYNVGDYEGSTEAFEQIENKLPFRTLWYQIEPIESYFELKEYDKVFEITNKVLNNHNRAFSELYILRGKIYQERGQTELARAEFEKAIFYNSTLKVAQDLLSGV